jgi:hypothetical protein
VREKNDDARAAGSKLIAEGNEEAKKAKIFIYVNTRLEGNALEAISALLDATAP